MTLFYRDDLVMLPKGLSVLVFVLDEHLPHLVLYYFTAYSRDAWTTDVLPSMAIPHCSQCL